VPSLVGPLLVGALALAFALPVFLLAGFPFSGWALATVLWAAGHALGLVLGRIPLGLGNLAAAGVVGIGMMFRGVAVGVVLIAVAASNTAVGLSAALLYAFVFTLELGVAFATYFGGEPR
jgi:hypothetical protein